MLKHPHVPPPHTSTTEILKILHIAPPLFAQCCLTLLPLPIEAEREEWCVQESQLHQDTLGSGTEAHVWSSQTIHTAKRRDTAVAKWHRPIGNMVNKHNTSLEQHNAQSELVLLAMKPSLQSSSYNTSTHRQVRPTYGQCCCKVMLHEAKIQWIVRCFFIAKNWSVEL